jgi:D-beta-D-heptose 7-phosphate kinase/D-beta-D-heptose 1-phosphate adenosyltransferase
VSTAGPLVVVGDALLDCDLDGQVSRLCPDGPAPVLDDPVPAWRPGGAALTALLAATGEVPVVLVAPLGDDEASATVRALLEPHVSVVSLPLAGTLPEKTRFRAAGRTLLRADRGGGTAGPAGSAAADAIAAAGAVLVSDYGRGTSADEGIRAALSRQASRVPLVWDPHPRGASPVPHAWLVTPNYAEAVAAAGQPAAPGQPLLRSAAAAAAQLSRRWQAKAVAVTLGEHGALVVQGETGPLVVPAERLPATDPCGVGDQFAAAAAAALRQGALTSEAVTAATAAASADLAAGGAGRYSSASRAGRPRAAGRRPPARPGRG